MDMTNEALEARRAYHRKYRAAHRDQINEKARAWKAAHPEAVKAQNARYWQRRAEKAKAEAEQN